MKWYACKKEWKLEMGECWEEAERNYWGVDREGRVRRIKRGREEKKNMWKKQRR